MQKQLHSVLAAAVVLALAFSAFDPVHAGVEEYTAGVDGHGYALSLGGHAAVAAIKTPYFNFSDPGISGWDKEITLSLWMKFLNVSSIKTVSSVCMYVFIY